MKLVLAAAFAMIPAAADAQISTNWPQSEIERMAATPKSPVPAPRPRIKHRPRPKPVVQAPVQNPRCLPPIEAVGDQALSESGAKDNAEKAWQQEMRFARGELYADPRNAQGQTYWCVKSSIGGGLFFRCRIKAAACAPEPK